MKNMLEIVLSTLAQNEIEIKKLEEKVLKLEQTSSVSFKDENKCEMCQYSASCPISVKSHITRNHKQEVMRSSLDDNSLDISIRSDQREHDISYLNRKVKMSYSPPLHPLPNTLTPTPLKNFLKNVLSLKSTKKFQKVPKSTKKYPKVPKSTQK